MNKQNLTHELTLLYFKDYQSDDLDQLVNNFVDHVNNDLLTKSWNKIYNANHQPIDTVIFINNVIANFFIHKNTNSIKFSHQQLDFLYNQLSEYNKKLDHQQEKSLSI